MNIFDPTLVVCEKISQEFSQKIALMKATKLNS